jgi:hypothetical protein
MSRLRRPAFRPGRLALAAALLALLGSVIAVPAAAAAEPEFPSGKTGFHTYAEMSAEVAKAATDHRSIVQRFSIGTSYKGRQLWAVKVSDNVATDEREPEVLFDGLHHGAEHMSLEMTLRILRWLTDEYPTNATIKRLVDTREIWIVFAVNPDGATYDIAGTGGFRHWRKNRQPSPGSSSIGTDVNRNYGYRWGCCGGSSKSPSSSRYRGPRAFSTPEAKALADFVRSRVVDGRQQIRAGISFHTTGRLVMWPYGYTYRNQPTDMTSDDHRAFVAMGRRMAASNGYRPIQASDLYISSGTSRDWLYGTYRIFSFTFELSPDSTPYPDDSKIASETGRNKAAVLDLIARAGCPYSIIGKADVRCGAFDDDFEVGRGWKVDPDGTDTATDGAWQRGNPAGTGSNGPKQLTKATSGIRVLVTGATAGSSASANDLDGGVTTIQSPPIVLPTSFGQRLTFRYAFGHGASATSADWLRVEVVEGGTATTVFEIRGSGTDRDATWRTSTRLMDAWAGETVRLRVSANDGGADSLVEAAIDDVRVTRP